MPSKKSQTSKVYELSARKRATVHKVVADCFAKIGDKPCWNPQQGHGSFLTLEFGEPHLIIDEYKRALRSKKRPSKYTIKRNATVHGEWHLLIWCCHWKLTLEDCAAHSESSRGTIEIALAHLRGQILTKVSVHPKDGSSIFEFDLGGKLETRRYTELDRQGEPYHNWMFFDNQGYVLTYRADGKYRYHPANEPSKEKDWLS